MRQRHARRYGSVFQLESIEPRILLSADLLDSSFGRSGVAGEAMLGRAYDFAQAIAVTADDKIVAAGHSQDLTNLEGQRPVLARYNADGSLDTTFGIGGRVLLSFPDFDGTSSFPGAVTDLAVQPDGKLLASVMRGGDAGLTVVRLNGDGTWDASFDEDGIAEAPIVADAYALTVDLQGRIVAVGGNADDFVVARFLPDGTTDAAFGQDGVVATDFAARADGARDIAIDELGRIVVAGYANVANNSDFAVARYFEDGSPDPSFGMEGRLTTDFDGADRGAAIAIAETGKIIVVGRGAHQTRIARYHPDGTLDDTFGSGGKLQHSVGEFDAVAALPDGRILVGGPLPSPVLRDFNVQRLNEDGSVDMTFGDEDGRVTTDFGNGHDFLLAMAVAADGRIVAAGFAEGDADGPEFALVRYTSEGQPDPTFDHDGRLETDFPGHIMASPNAVAVLPDGRLLVAGSGEAKYQFPLMRFHADGSIDPTFGDGGRAHLNPDPLRRFTIVNALAVASDGKIYAAGTLNQGFALARYEADGSVDASFGTAGVVLLDLFPGGGDGTLTSVELQSDGKVVIGGSDASRWQVMRLNVDGSVDPDFGSGGRAPLTWMGLLRDLAVTPDDAIVAVGDIWLQAGSEAGAVRLTPDGQLDASFGSDGGSVIATSAQFAGIAAEALLIADDGRFFVGGQLGGAATLWALTAGGEVHTSFGDEGRVTTAAGKSSIFRSLLIDEGTVIAAGQVLTDINKLKPLFASFDLSGNAMPRFGQQGVFLAGVGEDVTALALQSRGKLVAALKHGNNLSLGRFLNGTLLPVADIEAVSPAVRNTAVEGLSISFTHPVSGFDLSDLELVRDDGLDMLAGSGATLVEDVGSGGASYTLSGIAWLTAPPGDYTLRLKAAGSGIASITDGEPLWSDAIVTWTVLDTLSIEMTDADDHVRIVRNAAQPDLIDIYLAAGAESPEYSVYYPSLTSIAVQVWGGNDVVILDLSAGLFVGPFLLLVGGAGNDVLALTDAGRTIAIGENLITRDGVQYSHVGFETVTVPGQDLEQLTVDEAQAVALAGDRGAVRIDALSIAPLAKLDIGSHDLILPDGDLEAIESLLHDDRIQSADAVGIFGLAVGTSAGDVFVKLTYNGDANLDGRINFDDYFRIDSSYLEQPANPIYAQGDFNYDGTINFDDYFLIDSAFLAQGAPLASAAPAASMPTTSAIASPVPAEPQQKARKRAVRPIFSDEPVAASPATRRRGVAGKR